MLPHYIYKKYHTDFHSATPSLSLKFYIYMTKFYKDIGNCLNWLDFSKLNQSI